MHEGDCYLLGCIQRRLHAKRILQQRIHSQSCKPAIIIGTLFCGSLILVLKRRFWVLPCLMGLWVVFPLMDCVSSQFKLMKYSRRDTALGVVIAARCPSDKNLDNCE
jgi:hypothetical protein